MWVHELPLTPDKTSHSPFYSHESSVIWTAAINLFDHCELPPNFKTKHDFHVCPADNNKTWSLFWVLFSPLHIHYDADVIVNRHINITYRFPPEQLLFYHEAGHLKLPNGGHPCFILFVFLPLFRVYLAGDLLFAKTAGRATNKQVLMLFLITW